MKKIFVIVFLTLSLSFLLSCSGKDTNKAANKELNNYSEKLKQNNMGDTYLSNLDDARTSVTVSEEEAISKENFVPGNPPGYKAVYTKSKASVGLDELSYWGANDNYVYPGSLVKIADESSNDILVPITGLKRAPMTISPNVEGSTGTNYLKQTINNITLSNVRESIHNIVQNITTDDAQLPFKLSYQLVEVKSNEDLSIALGTSVKIKPILNLSNNFSFKSKHKRTYAIMLLKQIYYNIDVDYNAELGASGFFDSSVSLSEYQTIIKPNDIPAYVSSISYGRMAAITIASDYSLTDIQNKLKVKVNAGPVSVSQNVDIDIDNEDESMELNYFLFGGSIDSSQNVIGQANIGEILNNLNSKYDPKKIVGVPISYRLSHIGDNSLARVGSSSEYYTKELVPIGVENLYFTPEESKRIKNESQLGSKDIYLNAKKTPPESILFPVSYEIIGAHINNNEESILKESGSSDNIIAKIIRQNSEDKYQPNYILSLSNNREYLGKKFIIKAKAGSIDTGIITTNIEIEILKKPVESLEWDSNLKDKEKVYPDEEISLATYALPKNATFIQSSYSIIQGSMYAHIKENILYVNTNARDKGVIKVLAECDDLSIEKSFTIEHIKPINVTLKNNRNTSVIVPSTSLKLITSYSPFLVTNKEISYECEYLDQFITITEDELFVSDFAPIGVVIKIYAIVDGVKSNAMELKIVDKEILSIVFDKTVVLAGEKYLLQYSTSQDVISINNLQWVLNSENAKINQKTGELTINENAVSGEITIYLNAYINNLLITSELTITIQSKNFILSSNSNLYNLRPGDSVEFNALFFDENQEKNGIKYSFNVPNIGDYITFDNDVMTFNFINGRYPFKEIVISAISYYDNRVSNKIILTFNLEYFYIHNKDGLLLVNQHPNEKFFLLNDIDLYTNSNWLPIKGFKGIFDGNNKKISNLSIEIPNIEYYSETNLGLFDINNGEIKNVIISNFTAKSKDSIHSGNYLNIGSLCGINNGIIDNIKVSGQLYIFRTYSRVGGVLGLNNALIKNCESTTFIYSDGDIGGICGVSQGKNSKVSNCVFKNNTLELYINKNNRSVAGIVGYAYNSTVIENSSVSNATIKFKDYSNIKWNAILPCMGLIVGSLDSSTMQYVSQENSIINTGKLSSKTNNGSIFNSWYNQVRNCGQGPWKSVGFYNSSSIIK